MNNITFQDEIVKRNYQDILKKNKGLSKVILKLLLDGDSLNVIDVNNIEKGVSIILEQDDKLITISIDLLKKKIYVEKQNILYQEIYDNYPQKKAYPVGRLYKNNEREIIETLKFRLSDEDDVKYYELNENGNQYSIIIDIKDDPLWEELFITKLLYNYNHYSNIRDLFMTIQEVLDISHYDIKLGDSKGSNIVITNGKVEKYIEYYEEDDQYIKIYMENGEFFYERKVKEPYEDNMTSYVKKLGERNGKKER